jgi:hypothetical protein
MFLSRLTGGGTVDTIVKAEAALKRSRLSLPGCVCVLIEGGIEEGGDVVCECNCECVRVWIDTL